VVTSGEPTISSPLRKILRTPIVTKLKQFQKGQTTNSSEHCPLKNLQAHLHVFLGLAHSTHRRELSSYHWMIALEQQYLTLLEKNNVEYDPRYVLE
jgi:hypothetical protein